MSGHLFTLGAIKGVELTVFVVLFLTRQRAGLLRRRAGAGPVARPPRRVGPRRAQFRHLGQLVPDRRRPLHRVHVRRRAGAAVRDRRARLLRRAVHDHPVPDRVHRGAAPVVGRAPPRLRHAGRLRARPPRLRDAGAADRDHRDRRDDALHRAPARRHRRGHADDRHPGRVAADHRVRDPRGLHVPVGPACAGADRLRQGHADLPRRPRRGDLHPDQARRLRRHLRRGRQEVRREPCAERRHCSSPTRRSSATRRWPSAPRSRCSCTRTRSPACWRRAAATRSAATWRRCRPTASCSACSRCSASWRSRPASRR